MRSVASSPNVPLRRFSATNTVRPPDDGTLSGMRRNDWSATVQPLRVFVLSDVRLYSEGLAALLAAEPSILVVGAGALDSGTRPRIVEANPHILLVDATALRHVEFIREVRAAVPGALIVACGVSEEREEIIACAEHGAAGYVARDASADDLVKVVRSVERGELPCSPRIAAMLFRRMAMPIRDGRIDLGQPLTARERQVTALIDRGMSNKEIAASLGIELATVKNHVHHILEKLDVRRRSAAAARMRHSLSPRTI